MKPRIADNKPVPVELKAGEEYYFCTCGKSAKQPFCDGSHAGSDFSPKPFTAKEDGETYLCQCKQTANAPFCDGTHTQVPDDRIGKEFAVESPAGADAMPEAKATPEEPTVAFIHQLATEGLGKLGHHGPMGAMGVPRAKLPDWDGIQIMVAQLDRKPLMEDVAVGTELVIGPEAKRPLELPRTEAVSLKCAAFRKGNPPFLRRHFPISTALRTSGTSEIACGYSPEAFRSGSS